MDELHETGEDGTDVGIVELWYILCWLSKSIAQCCLCKGEVEFLEKGIASQLRRRVERER